MTTISARDWTNGKLEEMERHLRGIYSRAEKELGESWKDYMKKADAELERLGKAYSEAKKTGDKTIIREAGRKLAAEKQKQTIYNTRYQALTKDLAESISKVNQTAAAYINGQLPQIYSVNYNEVARNANDALRGRVSFDLVDAGTIKRLSTVEENLLPYKYINGKKDVRWNISKINSEVTQGILQGESIPNISKRLSAVLDMNKTSAIRNARTAVTSAENKGRIDMMHDAAEKGVIMKKGWSAHTDKRTRDSHLALDGRFVGMDEEFANGLQYPGDPDGEPEEVYNCRCALIYEVIGFGTKDKPSETEGDNVIWNRSNFEEMRESVQSIVDEAEYEHYGLRVQSKDTEKLGKEITHLSKNFGGDFDELSDESEVLNGVSTVGINNVNQVTQYGGYEGRVIYLVGAYNSSYGYDPGELILERAVVLAKGKIENGELRIIEKVEVAGKSEIVETTPEQAVANAVMEEAMKEYIDFKDHIIKKYGEENMWRDMTDAEMDKFEKLERKAYTGR